MNKIFTLGICNLLLLSIFITACNPAYVMQAAWEQGKILASREDITEVISNPETSSSERQKLQLVLDTREYAIEIGLKPGEAFTTYARIEGDVVSWLVAASRKDAFELHQWWFPIVGNVPYKGYFDKADAIEEAQCLQKKDLEVWVRGAEAFSTLGWFNDPLLSTTLRNEEPYIANTVLHESLHSTIWIPGHADFNESMAHFVGSKGAETFFAKRLAQCPAADTLCQATESHNLIAAQIAFERDRQLGLVLESLYKDLSALYQSNQSKEQKLQMRQTIFEQKTAALRSQYPQLRILKSVNNAEILLIMLYLTKMDYFESAWQKCKQEWSCFLNQMVAIKEKSIDNSMLNPFDS